jgi:VanZ family protein
LRKEPIHTRTIKESPVRRSFFYGGPVLAYAALIYFLSSMSSFPEAVPSFFGFDKVAHFMEYYFFGCLLCRWFSSMERCRKQWRVLLITILVGTGYALGDEWHQSFVPGRDASPWDALFDTFGVGMAAATYPLIRQKIQAARARLTKGGSS